MGAYTPRMAESSAAEGPRRILIIKPSSLGDIIHALPILAGLRQAYPHAHIAWVVANSFASLLEGHPLLNEVIRFDRARFGRMWRSPRVFADFWRFVLEVRRQRFDMAIDLQGLIRSGLLSFFCGARTRIGFADAREGASWLYTRRIRPPRQAEHAVERIIALGEDLGLTMRPARFPLAITAAERSMARGLTRESSADSTPIVAVIPGARWPSKLWQASKYVEIVRKLSQEGMRCVLLGAPSDRALADEICRGVQGNVVDLVGRTTLRELVAVIESARAVVCQDSGPMHIAAALNKPTVAVFGPTNPARTGPYSPAARVTRLPLPCSPCYRRQCPLGHHRCMVDLETDAVTLELRGLLADNAGAGAGAGAVAMTSSHS